jgi:uncharacterized protein DUF6328
MLMAHWVENPKGSRETLSLSQAAQHLLEEGRMVLPGIQALFGFQLIAVFSPGFSERLAPYEQRLHLLAIALVALAVALIMAPAAYHRQTGPREVTADFIRLSTRLLVWSMGPLALAISLDFFLIARLMLGSVVASLLAAVLGAVFVISWFVLPRLARSRRSWPDRT